MKKFLGRALLGLGGFLLVAGILGLVWAPGVVKKTPLDVNSTTYLTGEAAKLDTATGDFEPLPIYAISETKVDSEASTDDTVLWTSTSCAVFDTGGEQVCVDGDDPSLITAAIDVFATDRVDAEAVSPDSLPADAVPHEGLVNKFPFDAEQATYPYWDGTTGAAVDAVFDRTEEVAGLETYVYQVNIDEAPIEIAEGVDGTYTDVKEIFVEPRTGSILNQTDDQQRYLADGTQVLDLQLEFTAEQQEANAADADDNIGTLRLITETVPLVGFIGGGLCLLIGAFLLFRSRGPKADGTPTASQDLVGAGR